MYQASGFYHPRQNVLKFRKMTGTPRYDKAINMCDSIINEGSFQLENNYYNNFIIENENSKEVIFAMPLDKLIGDFGFQMHMYTLHWHYWQNMISEDLVLERFVYD